MQSGENTTYGDVCTEVGRELQSTASAAIRSGIEPWRIIPDPGEQSILQCPNICWAILPFHRDFYAAIALLSSSLRYVKNIYITLYLETLTRFPSHCRHRLCKDIGGECGTHSWPSKSEGTAGGTPAHYAYACRAIQERLPGETDRCRSPCSWWLSCLPSNTSTLSTLLRDEAQEDGCRVMNCRAQASRGQRHCNSRCICALCSQWCKHCTHAQCCSSERCCQSCRCCTEADADSDVENRPASSNMLQAQQA